MTTVHFDRYSIDGIGTIELPDGRSGTVWVALWVDPCPLTNDSMIAGREDLITAAVTSGNAELHLADGVHLNVAVSPLSGRYASIKLINPDLDAPVAQERAALEDGTAPMLLRQSLSIAGTAVLIVNAKKKGRVTLQAHSIDEMIPSVLEVSGESELIDAANHCATVRLELCGLTFRARVAGQQKDTGTLLVIADSMFRTMAQQLKVLRRH